MLMSCHIEHDSMYTRPGQKSSYRRIEAESKDAESSTVISLSLGMEPAANADLHQASSLIPLNRNEINEAEFLG